MSSLFCPLCGIIHRCLDRCQPDSPNFSQIRLTASANCLLFNLYPVQIIGALP
ncbi:hypothetical protein AM571_PC01214 (plasmid) [Rhizobium etli 8C-3]|uniref:Uncharacterized protein n=1 Tax=Rhizobium etli 8C-3 TaxID=538025 RepID=A0A1L5PFF7_RHIET|nr:hypothetical protein AM571_PC01214 [Rhizobium etli 8C-3]